MVLYHGSIVLVDRPEIRKGENFSDFGVGFYTTTSKDQAERWARVKMKRDLASKAYVTVYELDWEAAKDALQIAEFSTADEAWLDFVVNNRSGVAVDAMTDMHIGPVADDNVYQTLRLFETGVYEVKETVKRLKTEVLQDQWVFHTEKALSFLKFMEYIEVR